MGKPEIRDVTVGERSHVADVRAPHAYGYFLWNERGFNSYNRGESKRSTVGVYPDEPNT